MLYMHTLHQFAGYDNSGVYVKWRLEGLPDQE